MSSVKPILNEKKLMYLLEGEAAGEKQRAIIALNKAKALEARKDTVSVKIDARTTVLMSLKKARKEGYL